MQYGQNFYSYNFVFESGLWFFFFYNYNPEVLD